MDNPSGNGNGGDVSINTPSLEANIALISTEVQNGGGNAGNIQISANRVILDQGGIISSATSGTGGNIKLILGELLLMRRGSMISTNAVDGDGGSINIQGDSSTFDPFVVAIPDENSDIFANATSGGRGGEINIQSIGVFGFEVQEEIPEGGLNVTNDISEISALSSNPTLTGIVNINRPELELTEKLVNLPEDPTDSSQEIARGCRNFTGGSESSEFIDSGSGGLPPKPDDFTSGDAVWDDTRLTTTPTPQKTPKANIDQPTKSASAPIVPATGWVFNGKGDVTLVSHLSKANSSSFNSNSSSCRVR